MKIDEPFHEISTSNRKIQFMVCHRKPTRSLTLFGNTILCYRCIGVYFSFFSLLIFQIIGIITGFIFGKYSIFIYSTIGTGVVIELIFIILLHLPLVVDGSIQAYVKDYESKNIIRLVTGLLAGIGQYQIFLFIWSLIDLLVN